MRVGKQIEIKAVVGIFSRFQLGSDVGEFAPQARLVRKVFRPGARHRISRMNAFFIDEIIHQRCKVAPRAVIVLLLNGKIIFNRSMRALHARLELAGFSERMNVIRLTQPVSFIFNIGAKSVRFPNIRVREYR